MLKFHDIEQNTEEWLNLRRGKITASSVGQIMSHYPKSFGDPAKRFAQKLAVERVTGKRISENYSNAYMEKGHDLEHVARELYEEHTFSEVSNGGFFELKSLGCSPDGLVGDDGGIEIKCEKWNIFFPYLSKGGFNKTYSDQIQFNLFVTGRKWWDFVSYCEEMPEAKQLHIHRIYPDEDRHTDILIRIKALEKLIEENISILTN